MNLDAHDKNALVSLSLTDEPIAVDVVRHSNQDKVIAWIFFFFFTLTISGPNLKDYHQLCVLSAVVILGSLVLK